MMCCTVTSILRFTNRPLLLSSSTIALEESVTTNLQSRFSNYRSTVGTCRNSTSDTNSDPTTKGKKKQRRRAKEEECFDWNPKPPRTLYRRAVHVIHRHGDRTPITPLKDEEYWTSQLVPPEKLQEISQNTKILEHDDHEENMHNANGRGPFGKLTSLGLQQMIDVGMKLRQQLAGENNPIKDEQGRTLYPHIFTPTFDPLHPMSIRVRCTNFVRTIQSVQGFIRGLIPIENYRFFPPGTPNASKNIATIDIRHTNWMIPDPQPRNSQEQAVLELELSQQPHLIEKEIELLPFAIAMTKALQPLLAEDARDADFGVPQQELDTSSRHNDDDGNSRIKPLSWNQLAEITKCLAVRNLLPDGITKEDQERISQHAAYRWYESFRHPRLSYLAMDTLTRTIVGSLLKHNPQEDSIDEEPVMNIWSAHDSTLICLMCAFRLEQPAIWPEYASYLLIELLDDQEGAFFYVRFSLNGQTLRSTWDPNNPVELIPLSDLWDHLSAQNPNSITTESILKELSYDGIQQVYDKYNEEMELENEKAYDDENFGTGLIEDDEVEGLMDK